MLPHGDDYHTKMCATRTAEERERIRHEHHAEMQACAKERGMTLPDVQENDKAYTVKAEMPGLKKEGIKVEIVGDTVSISAESKREEEVKEKGRIVRSERYHGSLYRSFSLGTEIDEADQRPIKLGRGGGQFRLPFGRSGARTLTGFQLRRHQYRCRRGINENPSI